ncbi:hypothetical protein Avbf_06738 [Armadillidium vulgare]|nr:hypothetical protein Avbf_06738 [Armadillidium vulgare]
MFSLFVFCIKDILLEKFKKWISKRLKVKNELLENNKIGRHRLEQISELEELQKGNFDSNINVKCEMEMKEEPLKFEVKVKDDPLDDVVKEEVEVDPLCVEEEEEADPLNVKEEFEVEHLDVDVQIEDENYIK